MMRRKSPAWTWGLPVLLGACLAVPAWGEDTGAVGAAATAPAVGPAAAAPVPPVAGGDAAPMDPQLADAVAAGQKLYLKNCRTCHGSKGTAGVPLAGNPKVQYDFGYLVWAIITGPGYMPEFGPALSDDEIAGIATFVLNSWGNSYGPVTAEDVHGLR